MIVAAHPHPAAEGRAPARGPGPAPRGGRLSPVLRAFYALPEVRARHADYLGGKDLGRADAVYVASADGPSHGGFTVHSPARLPRLLDRDLSAARSLWDRRSLLVHLDLEHVHFDRAEEPLLHQDRSRRLQRPVINALEAILDEYRIPHLRLITGRGQHIVWRIDRSSRVVSALAWLGEPGSGVRALYRERRPPAGLAVGAWLGSAHHGLGKILELLGHRWLARCSSSPIPVKLTAVTVGPGPAGREIVSFDLSQFGDPLHVRTARMPFTLYTKKLAATTSPASPAAPFVVVPVVAGDERRAIEASRSLVAAAQLARSTRVVIPEASQQTEALVVDYLASDLRRFHEAFEAAGRPRSCGASYDRLELDALPACVARILRHPNDLLLQPAALQHLVRALVALGWKARHVAELVRSRYERDHGWMPGVHFFEAGIRADFYVRLFAGLQACGLDSLLDFNCRSAEEKLLCTQGECGWNLTELRDRLAAARTV